MHPCHVLGASGPVRFAQRSVFSSPFPRLGVANMVRRSAISSSFVFCARFPKDSVAFRPEVRPKLVSQVVHRPAPARARELGTVTQEKGLSPWPAWPAGAAMGRYGPLWATMGRYGPLWAAMGRYGPLGATVGRHGPLWAALGRSGPLWAALGRSGLLWAAFGRSGPLGPLRPAGKLWGF